MKRIEEKNIDMECKRYLTSASVSLKNKLKIMLKIYHMQFKKTFHIYLNLQIERTCTHI